jgi:UDP-4-amino-4,6-dideoxy-N-acetyl-beta-L-altrosamine transaminase
MIPYSRQHITEGDIAAVREVLQSEFLTQGPVVPRFEKSVANYSGSSYGVATSSATSALHVACCALNLGPGDWLWTSPNSFVASANCALYCGANVDFVDIDPQTYNMSTTALASKLLEAEKLGTLPKIVIPVHFAGQSCDMDTIATLSKRFGFRVIEDASHAIGASYKGVKVGSCVYSDITVFSFHPVKIITTGEGGMALTNNIELAERMRLFRAHGITNNKALMDSRPENEIWNYQQVELGFNYRMTDIQAALGLSQMRRLNTYVRARRRVAECYDTAFKSLPIITPYQSPETHSSYHLYPIRVVDSERGKAQKRIYGALWQRGVAANVHYIPVYLHPYYRRLGFKTNYLFEAEKFFNEVITIPIFPQIDREQLDLVISTVCSTTKCNEA